jgi:hypothetical protein
MSIDGLPNDVLLSHIHGMFASDDEPERVSVSLSGDEIDRVLQALVYFRVNIKGVPVQQSDEWKKLERYLERMGP